MTKPIKCTLVGDGIDETIIDQDNLITVEKTNNPDIPTDFQLQTYHHNSAIAFVVFETLLKNRYITGQSKFVLNDLKNIHTGRLAKYVIAGEEKVDPYTAHAPKYLEQYVAGVNPVNIFYDKSSDFINISFTEAYLRPHVKRSTIDEYDKALKPLKNKTLIFAAVGNPASNDSAKNPVFYEFVGSYGVIRSHPQVNAVGAYYLKDEYQKDYGNTPELGTPASNQPDPNIMFVSNGRFKVKNISNKYVSPVQLEHNGRVVTPEHYIMCGTSFTSPEVMATLMSAQSLNPNLLDNQLLDLAVMAANPVDTSKLRSNWTKNQEKLVRTSISNRGFGPNLGGNEFSPEHGFGEIDDKTLFLMTRFSKPKEIQEKTVRLVVDTSQGNSSYYFDIREDFIVRKITVDFESSQALGKFNQLSINSPENVKSYIYADGFNPADQLKKLETKLIANPSLIKDIHLFKPNYDYLKNQNAEERVTSANHWGVSSRGTWSVDGTAPITKLVVTVYGEEYQKEKRLTFTNRIHATKEKLAVKADPGKDLTIFASGYYAGKTYFNLSSSKRRLVFYADGKKREVTLPKNQSVKDAYLGAEGGKLIGNELNNELHGSDKNDILVGRGGNDILKPYGGTDVGHGQSGSDIHELDARAGTYIALDDTKQANMIDLFFFNPMAAELEKKEFGFKDLKISKLKNKIKYKGKTVSSTHKLVLGKRVIYVNPNEIKHIRMTSFDGNRKVVSWNGTQYGKNSLY